MAFRIRDRFRTVADSFFDARDLKNAANIGDGILNTMTIDDQITESIRDVCVTTEKQPEAQLGSGFYGGNFYEVLIAELTRHVMKEHKVAHIKEHKHELYIKRAR